jgi:hypothetical protein
VEIWPVLYFRVSDEALIYGVILWLQDIGYVLGGAPSLQSDIVNSHACFEKLRP